MKLIVITGGIGSGKSEVCRILCERFDIPVYEADAKVKMLYVEHPTLLDDIESHLGESFRKADGNFDPSALAKRIFSDDSALTAVEELVFPALMDDFRLFMKLHQDAAYIVFESATVLEKPQFDGFGDFVVLVDAPKDLRMMRAMERDSVPESKVAERMDKQILMNHLSEGGEDDRINFRIINDSSKEILHERVAELMEKLA